MIDKRVDLELPRGLKISMQSKIFELDAGSQITIEAKLISLGHLWQRNHGLTTVAIARICWKAMYR